MYTTSTVTWEVPTAGSEDVPYRRHAQDDVQVVGTLVHEVLPHAVFGRPRAHLQGLFTDLIQDGLFLVVGEQSWNHSCMHG